MAQELHSIVKNPRALVSQYLQTDATSPEIRFLWLYRSLISFPFETFYDYHGIPLNNN